jgi:hypothetical protein
MVDRQTQDSIDRYKSNITTVQAFLDRMTAVKTTDQLKKSKESKLEELHRIKSQTPTPDSMPGGGSRNGGKSADETTATESAALRGLPAATRKDANGNLIDNPDSDDWDRHVIPDPIDGIVDEVLAGLVELAGIAKLAARKLDVVDYRPALLKEKERPLDRCQACQRWVAASAEEHGPDFEDIDEPLDVVSGYLRSGYCDSCRKAWDRAGKPDRPTFERERLSRHQKAKEDRIMQIEGGNRWDTKTPAHSKGA